MRTYYKIMEDELIKKSKDQTSEDGDNSYEEYCYRDEQLEKLRTEAYKSLDSNIFKINIGVFIASFTYLIQTHKSISSNILPVLVLSWALMGLTIILNLIAHKLSIALIDTEKVKAYNDYLLENMQQPENEDTINYQIKVLRYLVISLEVIQIFLTVASITLVITIAALSIGEFIK